MSLCCFGCIVVAWSCDSEPSALFVCLLLLQPVALSILFLLGVEGRGKVFLNYVLTVPYSLTKPNLKILVFSLPECFPPHRLPLPPSCCLSSLIYRFMTSSDLE